jgi:hypothetical protein
VHVLVSDGPSSVLVNVETRAVAPATAEAAAVAPLVGSGAGLVTLTAAGDRMLLRRYDDAGAAQRDERTLDLTPYRTVEPAGRGWRYGGRLAQALRVAGDPPDRSVVTVVDEQSARVTNVLAVAGTGGGCCTVLGWANRSDVLVHGPSGLLAWDLGTGTLNRLTEPLNGAVSVAPTGCGWSVSIAGITSSCAESASGDETVPASPTAPAR